MNGERNNEILRRFDCGETLQSIADSFGLTRERVRQIVKRMGVVPRHEQIARRRSVLVMCVSELAGAGMTRKQIAAALEISYHDVIDLARAGGIEIGRHDLSRTIREMQFVAKVNAGMSFAAAAKACGFDSWLGRLLAVKHNLKAKRGPYIDRAERLRIVQEMRAAGGGWPEIALQVSAAEGVSVTAKALYQWARKRCPDSSRIAFRTTHKSQPRTIRRVARRASVVAPSQLTVAEVAAQYRGKATAREIAAAMGVSRNVIIGHWYRLRQKGVLA